MNKGIPEGWEVEEEGLTGVHVTDDSPAMPAAPAAPTQGLPEGFEIESMPDEEGLTGSVTYTAPKLDPVGGGFAMDADELKTRLREMTAAGASAQELREYINGSGFRLDEPSQEWLDQGYAENPNGDPVEFDVTPPPPDISAGGSAWAGLKSGSLMGFDDEWSAGWGAAGNKLGTALGLNDSTASFGDIYDAILMKERAYKDQAYEQNQLAYGVGFVPGALASAFVLPGGRGTQAEGLGTRVAHTAGTGALAGSISGAGNAEGGWADRLSSAATGGATGAAFGAAAMPLAGAVGTLARRAAGYMPGRGRNAMSHLDVLTDRAPQNIDNMRTRADVMRAANVEPRLVDVVDESARGVFRTAANKMTPAREDVVTAADDVYGDAQSRIAAQARRTISNEPRTARQLAATIREEQAAMGPQFDAVRTAPVTITPEIRAALDTTEGRTVLRSISRWLTPDEADSLDTLVGALKAARKQGSAEDQARKLFPQFDRLTPQAQQQMLSQLGIKDPMADAVLTVDIADKFARVLNQRAGDIPALRRVAGDMADTVRGAARQQHPDYDNALVEFERRAGVADAAAGTGRFENTDFLSTPPDQFQVGVAEAGNAIPPPGGPNASDVLRQRARDDVVDVVTSGSGSQAVTTARQLARGEAQRGRNAGLLGGRGAEDLQAGMGAEVRRVENTRFIDPRAGSKTASVGEDSEALGDVLGGAANAATGGKWGVVRWASSWLRNAGIRNVDAERLARQAIDDTQVDDAINYLEQSGLSRARSIALVRAMGGALGGRTAGAAVATEERPPAPNSVRALIRQ